MSENSNMGAMERIAKMNTLKPEEVEEAEVQAGEIETEEYSDIEETPVKKVYYSNGMEAEKEYEKEIKKKEKARIEHSDNCITLNSTPSTEDMFRFMFRHTYFNFVGIIGLLISISAIVMLIIGYGRESTMTTVLLIGVSLVFTIINPLNLLRKSSKQAKDSSAPAGVITYSFSDAGFDMTRREEYAGFEWSNVFKIIEGKTGFFVYLGKNQAFIIPKHNIEGREERLREMFRDNVNGKRCRIAQESKIN